jgi:ATP/ADP translocase
VSPEPSAAPDHRLVWSFCALAGAIFWGYGIAASAAQIMFLELYGAEKLPFVWAAVGLGCVVAVAGLSWGLRRMSVSTALMVCAGSSALCFSGLFVAEAYGVPGAVYALFVFKDVYIVLLSELFWSLANSEFKQLRAFKVYGLFCAAGSLGGALGNLLAGPVAAACHVPNRLIFHLVVPLCLLAGVCTRLAERRLKSPAWTPARSAGPGNSLSAFGQSCQVVRHSRMLPLMLLLVLVVQISITVADFHFNRVLVRTYPDPDARRQVFGSLSAVINGVSLALQLGTGLVVRCLGMAGTMLSVPLSLLCCVGLTVAAPSFVSISLVRIVGKSADYSLFRAVKEFLYIPLTYRERTMGKAMIDMLTYRLAKAPAAALLWGITVYCRESALGLLNAVLCVLWLGLTLAILRRRATMPCAEEEIASTMP